MEAFYGMAPATPLPRPSELGSPESPQCVLDFDEDVLQVKASRRSSNSSDVSNKSSGSNPISVTTACLTLTSDEEITPVRKERRKVVRPKAKETNISAEAETMEGKEADESSSALKRRTGKPKSSRHNWMSTMGSGGGSQSGSMVSRSSRRGKLSDSMSLSGMSAAVSVQSETSEMGGSTASAMRKKKKKSSRSMSQHSSTLSVGSMRRTRDDESSRQFSSASVGGRPRMSTKSSRRVSSSESLSKADDSVGKAAIRAADKKANHKRLSTKGTVTRSKSALVKTSIATRQPLKKSVSFDYVEIREYARMLGDNPSVRKGPPLALDWEYIEALCLGVEEYEKKRGNRRTYVELQMPRYLRETLLQEHCDVSEREVAQCMREIKKIKRQRQQSVAIQDGAQVLLEKAGRGLKRIFQKKSNKKEEDELWESAKQFALLKMQQQEMEDLAADVGDEDTVM